MDLRYQLRMMGIPITGPTYLFGDNLSVITSDSIPQSPLTKRHNALAYHQGWEAVAAKIILLMHIDGKENPADIMTKFLPHSVFWPFVRPLLFWRGETGGDPNISPMRGVTGGIVDSGHGQKLSAGLDDVIVEIMGHG